MSLHSVSRFANSKSFVKLCGTQGPFCLPHTEMVLVPKQCPLVWRLATVAPFRPRTGNPKDPRKPILNRLTLTLPESLSVEI